MVSRIRERFEFVQTYMLWCLSCADPGKGDQDAKNSDRVLGDSSEPGEVIRAWRGKLVIFLEVMGLSFWNLLKVALLFHGEGRGLPAKCSPEYLRLVCCCTLCTHACACTRILPTDRALRWGEGGREEESQ